MVPSVIELSEGADGAVPALFFSHTVMTSVLFCIQWFLFFTFLYDYVLELRLFLHGESTTMNKAILGSARHFGV